MSEAAKLISKQKSFVQLGLVVVLAAIVAIAALPSYFSGQWPWNSPLEVPQLNELRESFKTPPTLAGWETTAHQEVKIGGHSWNFIEYRPSTNTATQRPTSSIFLLLKPQTSSDKQPEVEWVDIAGSQGWQVDDVHPVKFSVAAQNGQEIEVTTRYLRGLEGSNTFAAMQWYAWSQGGHFAPGKWFWADQGRQWQRRERMPWVAICLLLPIEPVGNIRNHTQEAIAIAQAIQTDLMQGPLAD